MNDQVILSLDTYHKMLDTIRELREEKNGIFKANRIGSTVYIELDEKGAEVVNAIAAQFSETHEVRDITPGITVVYLNQKKEDPANANDTVSD